MKNTYLRPLYALSLFLFIFATICSGQSTSKTKFDKINDLIHTYVDYGKFNGAVLVSEKGNIIYKKGLGFANIEWDIPNQPNTKFRIASVSKQFTAMLIMQLVAEKKLALDVPITTYLSSYPKVNGDKINIHHLLTHTSGIPNYTSFPIYRDMMPHSKKPEEIIQIFVDSTLQFSPGERFSYSNSGYVLLGAIIEKLTGQSFDKVLQEKILTPLKMINTGYDNTNKLIKNHANGYNKHLNSFVPSNYIDMSMAFTAGGIYSTVEDLYLWDQALYTEKLLPQKYLDMIFTKHIPAWGQDYGYGWNIGQMRIGNTHDIVETIDHDGVINGFNAIIVRFPTDQSSIILLNNAGNARLYKMTQAISGIIYDKSYDFPKMSVANKMLDIIKKDGIATGLSFFTENKDNNDYKVDENEMNLVGYDLLQSGYTDKAISIFKLIITEFPNSFNAYDSYGEALMTLGQNKEAIKNYKKSLKLNPENENGIEMLKKLGVEIDRADLYLLRTDKTWGKEIFTFPLRFAKDINYEGIEEAHFPKGWRNVESNEYWSYVFAWNINLNQELTISQLESDLQLYFDGLATAVNKDKNKTPSKAIAKIHEIEALNKVSKFKGSIEIYDAFITNKVLKLNVLVEKHYCDKKKESVVFFRYSPKDFDHEIWKTLHNIKLRDNYCKD